LQPFWKSYTARVNEIEEFSHTQTETQAQPRDVIQRERNRRRRESDEKSNRERQAVGWRERIKYTSNHRSLLDLDEENRDTIR
jgi:hypothetical protein